MLSSIYVLNVFRVFDVFDVIEYWKKKPWRETSTIELKRKFYQGHSLKVIDIYEDDLHMADSIITRESDKPHYNANSKNLEKETG